MTINSTTITKELFGGKIDFVIYGSQQDDIRRILGEVYAEGLRLQKIFNIYDPKSELSELNKLRKKEVSEELLAVIKKAIEFSELTSGSYDISLGRFILLRKQGKNVIPTCSYKDIHVNANEVVLSHPDVLIDLGSIAKGYITDRLTDLLQKKGLKEFMIDARGDICVKGKQIHVLGVENPRKDSSIFSIKIQNEAVATSGDYKQYVGDFENSHIINQNDATSVTVVAPTLEEADVYATALFTCSENQQKSIIKDNKHIKVLMVKNSDILKMFNNFENILYEA